MQLRLYLVLGLVCLLTIQQVSSLKDKQKHRHDDPDDEDDDDKDDDKHDKHDDKDDKHDDDHKDKKNRQPSSGFLANPAVLRPVYESQQAPQKPLQHHQQQHQKQVHLQPKPQLQLQPQYQARPVVGKPSSPVSGTRQSPIAIRQEDLVFVGSPANPLKFNYPLAITNLNLTNTGHHWEVKMGPSGKLATVSGGPLTGAYQLEQFHSHWGATDREGSEHTVNGRRYAGELHFVHYNERKYGTLAEAAKHPDGLAVVAVFLESSTQVAYPRSLELEKIASQLRAVQSKGQFTYIKQAVDIRRLLPTDKSYWTYPGSLTTKPFSETVTWLVLKEPIKCTPAQLREFRSLKELEARQGRSLSIKQNFREVQPLNGRKVINYDDYKL